MTKTAVGRGRLVVLAAAGLVTVVKLWLAWQTFGSNDVGHFLDFAKYVHKYGPIGIYGHWDLIPPPYNHPPLIGWMLSAMNFVSRTGLRMEFLVRLPATISDVISAVLVYFELLRASRPLREAVVGGLIVAVTPILIVISGFHGNTDPAFVMFAMLKLLPAPHRAVRDPRRAVLRYRAEHQTRTDRRGPASADHGVALGRRRLGAFVLGSGLVFVLLWVPVIVKQWAPFQKNVLGYPGYGERRWGIPAFIHATGASADLQSLVEGPGRFVVLAISAGIPAYIAWRRPQHNTIAFGLTLSMFLLLSTASATQYLAWAAAPSGAATAYLGGLYNLTGGVLLVDIYDSWNRAYPWDWYSGRASGMTSRQTIGAAFVWLVLLAVVITGLWNSRRSGPQRPGSPDVIPVGEDEDDAKPDAALTSTVTEKD